MLSLTPFCLLICVHSSKKPKSSIRKAVPKHGQAPGLWKLKMRLEGWGTYRRGWAPAGVLEEWCPELQGWWAGCQPLPHNSSGHPPTLSRSLPPPDHPEFTDLSIVTDSWGVVSCDWPWAGPPTPRKNRVPRPLSSLFWWDRSFLPTVLQRQCGANLL